jgi:hypothetical protein
MSRIGDNIQATRQTVDMLKHSDDPEEIDIGLALLLELYADTRCQCEQTAAPSCNTDVAHIREEIRQFFMDLWHNTSGVRSGSQ